MSNSSGVISTPVDLRGDIGSLLGVSSGDLGYNVRNGDINAYAKFKPIIYPGIATTKDTDPYFYRGTAGDCGLTFTKLTYTEITIENVEDAVEWTSDYDNKTKRPSGNLTTQPFRALDFDGYNHNETSPITITLSDFPSALYSNTSSGDIYAVFGNIVAQSSVATYSKLVVWDFMQNFTGPTFYRLSSGEYSEFTDSTMYGIFGVLVIVQGSSQQYAYMRSICYAPSVTPSIEIDLTAIPDEAPGYPTSWIQSGTNVTFAPCLTNVDTQGVWVVANAAFVNLEVILLPASVAYSSYTITSYTPPVVYDYEAVWDSAIITINSGVSYYYASGTLSTSNSSLLSAAPTLIYRFDSPYDGEEVTITPGGQEFAEDESASTSSETVWTFRVALQVTDLLTLSDDTQISRSDLPSANNFYTITFYAVYSGTEYNIEAGDIGVVLKR